MTEVLISRSGSNHQLQSVVKLPPLRTSARIFLICSILASTFYFILDLPEKLDYSVVEVFGNFLVYFLLSRTVVKWFSIACLTFIVWSHCDIKSKQDKYFIIALLFHSIGDISINYSIKISIFWFLLGHIFYICAFCVDLPKELKLPVIKKIFFALVLLYNIWMASKLLPSVEPHMAVLIAIYMIVISTMLTSAHIPNYKLNWVAIGTVLYIVSDSILALDTFSGERLPRLVFLIWPTYYIGQFLICIGFLKEKNKIKFKVTEKIYKMIRKI